MPEKPKPLFRGEVSAPPPPLEEFIAATSMKAPKIVDDDRLSAIERAIIPMQTKIGALETRFDEHRTAVDASISEVKAHLTQQDETAKGRDEKIDSMVEKTDRVLEIIEARDDRERNRRISQLDEEEKRATIVAKKTDTEVKLTKAERDVVDGRGRRIRLWIKAAGGLAFILVVIGSALGINRCNHIHGIETPGGE